MIQEQYINFLEQQIGGVDYHHILIENLFRKEFYSPLEKDVNRASYGLLLRQRFIILEQLDPRALDFLGPCRVLEMLIALAEAVDTYGSNDIPPIEISKHWFWEMMSNLGLEEMTDYAWNLTVKSYFDHKIDILLDRKYEPNGYGGLFPLQFPKADQRQIELWFQLQSYLLEKNGDQFSAEL